MEAEEITLKSLDTKQNVWVLVIIALALFVRLIGMSSMPFTADDSSLAADALAIAKNESVGDSSLPAYTGVTGLLFYVFGSTNLVARIVPIIAGVSVVFAAYLFMKRYNNKAALILAIVLALDWFMVSMSRQINTPLIALAALIWGHFFYEKKKLILSGLFLGIAFLGGYSFWVFVIGVLIIFLINRFSKNEEHFNFFQHPFIEKKDWLKLVSAFLVTVVLVSTGFLLNPSGLGNIGSGLLHFFSLFVKQYQLPFYHGFYVVLKHMFLPLITTIVFLFSRIKNHQKSISTNLLWILLFGFTATTLLGRHDLGLAVMIVIPLWAISSVWLSGITIDKKERIGLKISVFSMFVVLMTYVGLTLTGFVRSNPADTHFISLGIAALAGLLLIVVLIWLGSFVFETRLSIVLFTCALVFVLSFVSAGQTFNSLNKNSIETQLSLNHGPILLANTSQLTSTDIFESYGRLNTIEANIQSEELNQDLRWAFRDYKLNKASLNPELIISASEKLPHFDEPYRGMRIEFSRFIPWKSMNIQALLESLVTPVENWQIEGAFLWAQTKLFSGANQ